MTKYYYKTIASPVGVLKLVASVRGLSAVRWQHDGPERMPGDDSVEDPDHPMLAEAEKQLNEYFAKQRKTFSLELDFVGTEFQQKVWHALFDIPYGETCTYGDIARRVGSPNGVRAVGGAVNKNPIAIIAPCHRVIGASGKLVGFGGGAVNKTILLKLEEKIPRCFSDAHVKRVVQPNPAPVIETFSSDNFHSLCNHVAAGDADLKSILDTHGYPPMWTRPNTFESLVHIILEQQVSLASALAALNKLREKLGTITPPAVLALSDEALKACYFSRQKTAYTRHLAEAIQQGEFNLQDLETLPSAQVRAKVIALKGLGNWTADIYLMFVLRRTDIFPVGDLAAVNALKQVKGLSRDTSIQSLQEIAATWQPYRTVATMVLWHHYLSSRKKNTTLRS